ALELYGRVARGRLEARPWLAAVLGVGGVLMDRKDYRGAIAEFRRILDVRVQGPDLDGRIANAVASARSYAQLNIGRCYLQMRDYRSALDAFRSLREGFSRIKQYAEYGLYEGLCYEHLRQWDRAVRAYFVGVVDARGFRDKHHYCGTPHSPDPAVPIHLVDLYYAAGQREDLERIIVSIGEVTGLGGKSVLAKKMRRMMELRDWEAESELPKLAELLKVKATVAGPDKYDGRRLNWEALQAARLLARHSAQAVPLLEKRLTAGDANDRKWVHYALGLCATPRAVVLLKQAARDETNSWRVQTIIYSLTLAGPRGQAALDELSKDPHRNLKAYVDRAKAGKLGEHDKDIRFPDIPAGLKLPKQIPFEALYAPRQPWEGQAAAGGTPPRIPEVGSLVGLRRLTPVTTLDDWQIRLALASPHDDEEGMPWKLLYAHLRYAGKNEKVSAPDSPYGRESALGPLGYSVAHAERPEGPFPEPSVTLTKRLKTLPLFGEERWLERLYCTAVPMPAAGAYRIRVHGWHSVRRACLAEQVVVVPSAGLCAWSGFAAPATADGDGSPGQVKELAARPRPGYPQYPRTYPIWVLERGESFVETPISRRSLPGRLPAPVEWLGFRPGGVSLRYKLPEGTHWLGLAHEGDRFILRMRESADLSDEHLLARWWVNGRGVSVAPAEAAEAAEAGEERRPKKDRPIRAGPAEARVRFGLPKMLGPVKAGDKVAVQVMYCPHGYAVLSRPKPDCRSTLTLSKVAGPLLPVLPLLSNRLEFEVTAAMLKALSAPAAPAAVGAVEQTSATHPAPPTNGQPRVEMSLRIDRKSYHPMEDIWATVRFTTESESELSLRGAQIVNGGPLGVYFEVKDSEGNPVKYIGWTMEFGRIPEVRISKGKPYVLRADLKRLYKLDSPGEYHVTAKYADNHDSEKQKIRLSSEPTRIVLVKPDSQAVVSTWKLNGEHRTELVRADFGKRRVYLVTEWARGNARLCRRLPDGCGVSDRSRIIDVQGLTRDYVLAVGAGKDRTVLLGIVGGGRTMWVHKVPVDPDSVADLMAEYAPTAELALVLKDGKTHRVKPTLEEVVSAQAAQAELTYDDLGLVHVGRRFRIETTMDALPQRYAASSAGFWKQAKGGIVFTGFMRELGDCLLVLVPSESLLKSPYKDIPSGQKVTIKRGDVRSVRLVGPDGGGAGTVRDASPQAAVAVSTAPARAEDRPTRTIITADGKKMVVYARSRLVFYDGLGADARKVTEVDCASQAVIASKQGKFIVVCPRFIGAEGQVKIYDSSGAEVGEFEVKKFWMVRAVSDEGPLVSLQWVIAGPSPAWARLCDKTGKVIFSFEQEERGGVRLDFTRVGSPVMWGIGEDSRHFISLLDQAGKVVRTHAYEPGIEIDRVDLHTTSGLISLILEGAEHTQRLDVWNSKDGTMQTIPGGKKPGGLRPGATAVSPNGQYLAVRKGLTVLMVIDLPSGDILAERDIKKTDEEFGSIAEMLVSDRGTVTVLAGLTQDEAGDKDASHVYVLTKTGREISSVALRAHAGRLVPLANGSVAAVGRDYVQIIRQDDGVQNGPAVQPGKVTKEQVAARIRNARAGVGKRAVVVVLHESWNSRRSYSFGPAVAEPPKHYYSISAEEARKLLDVLVESGFFERAEAFDMADPHYPGATVAVQVHWSDGFYQETIDWGNAAVPLLSRMRKACRDGTEAAKAFDEVLEAVKTKPAPDGAGTTRPPSTSSGQASSPQMPPGGQNPRVRREGNAVILAQDATNDDLAQLRDEKGIVSLRMGGSIPGAAGPFITDAGLANIEGWKDLRILVLPGLCVGPNSVYANAPHITDAGLKHLAGLTELEKLVLYGQRITDAGLVHLADMTNLRELWLEFIPLTDAALAHLRNLRSLKVLRFHGAALTDEGIAHLAKMTQMEDLQIGRSRITDKGLEIIAAMKKLKKLDLQGTRITDRGLANLEGLSELTWLALNDTDVSDAGLEHLKALGKLEWLFLDGTKVTGAGLKHLKGLSNLRVLCVSRTKVDDEGLESLTALTKLERLTLNQTRLTDAGLLKLKNLTALRELEVRQTPTTEEGISKLKELAPDLKVLGGKRTQGATQPTASEPATRPSSTVSREHVEAMKKRALVGAMNRAWQWLYDSPKLANRSLLVRAGIEGRLLKASGEACYVEVPQSAVISLNLTREQSRGWLPASDMRTVWEVIQTRSRNREQSDVRMQLTCSKRTVVAGSELEVVVTFTNTSNEIRTAYLGPAYLRNSMTAVPLAGLEPGRENREYAASLRTIEPHGTARMTAKLLPTLSKADSAGSHQLYFHYGVRRGPDEAPRPRPEVVLMVSKPVELTVAPAAQPGTAPAPQEQPGGKKSWMRLYWETTILLYEGAPRDKLAARFRSITDFGPYSDYEKRAKELSELLDEMAKEDAKFKEPENLTALSERQRIRYLVFKLRDVAAQALVSGSPCSVLRDAWSQDTAAHQLRKIGKPAVPVLIGLLNDRRPTRSITGMQRCMFVLRYCDVALQILEAISARRFEVPIELSAADERTRSELIARVKEWWDQNKDKSEVEWIRDSVRSGTREDRYYGAKRAIELEGPVAAMKDPSVWIRIKTAWILGERADREAVGPLIAALKDEDARVRAVSAQALGKLGDPRALEALSAALLDKDAEVRQEAGSAIRQIQRAPGKAPATQPTGPGTGGQELQIAVVAERAKALKADIDKFKLILRYHGSQDKPYYNLELSVPALKDDLVSFDLTAQITEEQAAKIVEHLAVSGFMANGRNVADKDIAPPEGPAYTLTVSGPKDLELCEVLGWGLPMLERLDAL
ncbi:MAG: HEAT repeat domain-containing protein, partial [Planctomycetota bacterium]